MNLGAGKVEGATIAGAVKRMQSQLEQRSSSSSAPPDASDLRSSSQATSGGLGYEDSALSTRETTFVLSPLWRCMFGSVPLFTTPLVAIIWCAAPPDNRALAPLP